MSIKKVCVVTGTRAEYGLLKFVINNIQQSQKLKLLLLVTGMHLLKKFGYTLDNIKKDGFSITKTIPMYDENDNQKESLGIALGRAIKNFSKAFVDIKPDILLVLGDRYEPLAAVLAASTFFIPIAHIHGGDNVFQGQVDEQIRHAVTKFANIHFPVTPKSSQRIKLLGEEDWKIHMVGSPGIDMVYQENLLKREELFLKYKLDKKKKIVLCTQHPYVFEAEKAGKQMKITLQVLKDLNLQTIIIYPNNDPGSELIIEEIESNRNVKNFKIFNNLERKIYLSFLKNVDILVGNTSSGLIESPIFKVPVVNIGDRNKGRESGDNVLNVPHEYLKIKNAIHYALTDDFKKVCQKVKNPYGEGNASKLIVNVLENLEINKKLLVKKLTYNL